MTKFRYIITDTFDGVLKGTNDETTALVTARSEDHFVYDSQDGVWIDSDHERRELVEARKLEAEEVEEEESEDLDVEDEDEEEDDEE